MFYLMIDDTPWCEWQGTQAGQQVARKSGVTQCSYRTESEARDALHKLQPYFTTNLVIGTGDCPGAAEYGAEFFAGAKLTVPALPAPVVTLLWDIAQGLGDMRRRKVIDESDDGQWLAAKIKEATAIVKANRRAEIAPVPASLREKLQAFIDLEDYTDDDVDALRGTIREGLETATVPAVAQKPATVLIELRGGMIQRLTITGGPADVEARDYDTKGSDAEGLPVDDNGKPYFRSEWSNVTVEQRAGVPPVNPLAAPHAAMLAALEEIEQCRDYNAEHGTYPESSGIAADQAFDDWAADVSRRAIDTACGILKASGRE